MHGDAHRGENMYQTKELIMHTPSKTQQRILTAAAKEPTADIRASMTELKSPAIRDKVLQSMIKHGYVAERPLAGARPEKGEKIYAITEAGMATVPNMAGQGAASCSTAQRETKQATIIRLLSQEAGTTLAQLIAATSWQSHSVRGHLSNLRHKHGLPIETFTTGAGKRGYRIPEEESKVQKV